MKGVGTAIIDWNSVYDFTLAASCQSNCTIFDVNYGTEEASYEASNSIKCIAWSKCNKSLLATCTYEHNIFLWDTHEGMKNYLNIETESKVSKIAFSPTHEYIIASSHDTGVNLWDMRMAGKMPYKSHKINDFKSSLNLEFDQHTGLLLSCTKNKVYIYSDETFQHPIIINRSNIRNAKFTPFECGFSVIEQYRGNHLISFNSIYLTEDKLK